jgi:DHA1 family tetracycline resistance protein-like MFS transporter
MVENKKKHGFSVFSIFFTFFIDTLGGTIIFPIFAPLFLNPSEMIFSSDLSYNFKSAILGLFLAAYPLAQLIFAPLIGEFADRFGRKRSFLITTGFTLLGYTLCAFSIMEKKISLLFLSRLIMGASAGNLSLCLSALADLSSSAKEKIKYYGIGSMLAGISFVLGPFIGGKLSDPLVHGWFNLAFPMWIGAILALVNWMFLAFAFVETHPRAFKEPFDFMKGIRNIGMAFHTPSIKRLYLMYFFYLLSWNMLFQFIPAFLVTNFSAKNSLIGDVSALMGLAWVVGSFILYKGLLPYIKSKTTLLIYEAFLYAIILVLCAFIEKLVPFGCVLGVGVMIASFGWPLCAGAISNAAKGELQGRVLGLTQSIQSLAMLVAPVIVGPFLSKGAWIPFFIAAVTSLVFGGLAFSTKTSK